MVVVSKIAQHELTVNAVQGLHFMFAEEGLQLVGTFDSTLPVATLITSTKGLHRLAQNTHVTFGLGINWFDGINRLVAVSFVFTNANLSWWFFHVLSTWSPTSRRLFSACCFFVAFLTHAPGVIVKHTTNGGGGTTNKGTGICRLDSIIVKLVAHFETLVLAHFVIVHRALTTTFLAIHLEFILVF